MYTACKIIAGTLIGDVYSDLNYSYPCFSQLESVYEFIDVHSCVTAMIWELHLCDTLES